MKRRQVSEEKRTQHHLAEMDAADSQRGRLRKACLWLIAEARRARRFREALLAVIDLAYRVQKGLSLPDPAPGSPAHPDHPMHTALCGPAPAQRGTLTERRDVA